MLIRGMIADWHKLNMKQSKDYPDRFLKIFAGEVKTMLAMQQELSDNPHLSLVGVAKQEQLVKDYIKLILEEK